MKKTLGVVLATAILMQLFILGGAVSALESPVVSVTSASGYAGSTVTVTLAIANNPGFGGLELDLKFDNTRLELQSVKNKVVPPEGTVGLPMFPGDVSSINAANEKGVVSCYYVAIGNIEGDTALFDVTFRIKDNAAAGDSALTVKVVDGSFYYNGKLMSDLTATASNGKVTVKSPVTVRCPYEIDYKVSGGVVTVSSGAACKVGYKSGVRYIAINAVANSDGSYSFTAPEGVSEVFLVLCGDANLDGRVTAADIARINASKLGKTAIGADAIFAGDVDRNSALNDSDIDTIKNAVLRISELNW